MLRALILCALTASFVQGGAAGILNSNSMLRRSAKHSLDEPTKAGDDEDFGDLENLVQDELAKEKTEGGDASEDTLTKAKSSSKAASAATQMAASTKTAGDAAPAANHSSSAVTPPGEELDDKSDEDEDDDEPKGGIEGEFSDWLEKNHHTKKHNHKKAVEDPDSEDEPDRATDPDDDSHRRHHLPATAEEEFLQNAAKKALEDKERAEVEMNHNLDVEREAQRKLDAGKQLIKDIEMKKQNALKVAAQTAKSEKKKAEESAAEAIARSAAYEREVEKGKQEHEAVEQAKDVKERAMAELERISKDVETSKQQVTAQNAIAVSAAAEAAEERKLADKVASVMGEASRVERLKDAAREMSESKKKLEDEFRGRLPMHPEADDSFISEILGDAEVKAKGRHQHMHRRHHNHHERRKDYMDGESGDIGHVFPPYPDHKKKRRAADDEEFIEEEPEAIKMNMRADDEEAEEEEQSEDESAPAMATKLSPGSPLMAPPRVHSPRGPSRRTIQHKEPQEELTDDENAPAMADLSGAAQLSQGNPPIALPHGHPLQGPTRRTVQQKAFLPQTNRMGNQPVLHSRAGNSRAWLSQSGHRLPSMPASHGKVHPQSPRVGRQAKVPTNSRHAWRARPVPRFMPPPPSGAA